MPSLDLILEAERRGILPADKRPLLEEARRRGLVPGMAGEAGTTAEPAIEGPPKGHIERATDFVKSVPWQQMTQPDREIGRLVGTGVEGFNQGVANIGDLLTGSRAFSDLAKRLGMTGGIDPQTVTQRFANRIGQELGATAVPGGAAAATGRYVSRGLDGSRNVIQQLFAKAYENPGRFLVDELGIAVGAGAGAQVAREVAPGSDLAEAGGQLAGGTAAALKQVARPRVGQQAREEKTAQMLREQSSAQGELEPRLEAGLSEFGEKLPSVRPTLSQAADDKGLAALERTMAQTGAPQQQGQFADRYAAQSAAVRDRLRGDQTTDLDPDRAGQVIRQDIADRYARVVSERTRAVSPLYRAAEESPTEIDTANVFASIDDLAKGAKGEAAAALDAARKALMAGDKPDTSARGLNAARKEINRLIDKRGPDAYDSNTKRMLLRVRDDLDNALEAEPSFSAAQAKFKEMSPPVSRFEDPDAPTVAKAIEKPESYAKSYNVAEVDVPKLFVGKTAKPEDWKQLVKATGERSKAVEAAKNVLNQRLVRESSSNDKISAFRLGNFIGSNVSLLKEVYGQGHVASLHQIRNLVARLETAQKPLGSGSDTMAKYSIAKRLAETPIRQVGQLQPLSLKRLGRQLLFEVAERSDEKFGELVRDAVLNPQLAKDLLANLRTREGDRARVRLQTYIANLGGESQEK